MLTTFQTIDFERTCCRLFQKRVMLTISKPLILSVPAASYSRNVSCSLLSKPLILRTAAGTLKMKGLESNEHDAFLE
jgi:hypothetical protein